MLWEKNIQSCCPEQLDFATQHATFHVHLPNKQRAEQVVSLKQEVNKYQ